MTMYRIAVVGAVCLLLSSAFGQGKTFEVGLEGGPSAISLRGNRAVDQMETGLSYAAGIAFQYNFTDRLSIRSGVSMERKGATTNALFTDANGSVLKEIKVHSDFDYLTLPLLARFAFGSKVQFTVNAGPYLGYLLKAQERIDPSSAFPRGNSTNTELFERIDLGLTGGVGVVVPTGPRIRVSAEVRNNLGLFNISAGPIIDDGTIKTNSTVLLIGGSYRLGKS